MGMSILVQYWLIVKVRRFISFSYQRILGSLNSFDSIFLTYKINEREVLIFKSFMKDGPLQSSRFKEERSFP